MIGPEIDLQDRLIVGLDLPDIASAQAMVVQLGESVRFYKIGMELIYGGGLGLVERLVGDGKKVFVDLKLHDIPNTVEKATTQIAKLGATFLTIHGFAPTMRAAKAGAAGSGLKLLAVTVLTSFDDDDLKAEGYRLNVDQLVEHRALNAQKLGVDGIILSPSEVAAMRAKLGADMLLITPGIRPSGAALGDQKRVMTPSEALRAGADHLVIARPIIAAADPRMAALRILEEMAQVKAKPA